MMLTELFNNVPNDLAAYFSEIADDSLSGHEEFELNLLMTVDAVRWTKEFRDFHPVVDCLRGVILDDPNTSNHHVYLAAKSCAGSVLHLNHDGDSRIVFPTLEAFLTAARQSLKTGQSLSTFHDKYGVLITDQSGLHQLIVDLLDGHFDYDGTDIILGLIPSLELTELTLLERLVTHEDFYIAEAVGDAIARRPRRDLEQIARTCQKHSHFQAANAGSRAVDAIAELD